MKKVKLSRKIITSFLALLMIFTSLPITNTYAAVTDDNLGVVSAITDKDADIITSGNKTTVVFNNPVSLNWAEQNDDIYRGQDGWWVGINLSAPDLDIDILKESKYQSKAGTGDWSALKSFWVQKDSADDAALDEHFITLWAHIDEAKINNAINNNENITASWQFDWDYDSTESELDIDQTVEIQVVPSVVTLKKDDKQIYPVVPSTVEGITDKDADVSWTGTTAIVDFNHDLTLNWAEQNDDIYRGQDGWWVGINVSAPNIGVALLKESKYQSKSGSGDWSANKSFWTYKDSSDTVAEDKHFITLWTHLNEEKINDALLSGNVISASWQFDWNNDGVIDQTVTSKIDPSKINITLLDNYNVQVYPATALGTVNKITETPQIVSNGTNSVRVYYDDNIVLQWAQADYSIGRMVDGWWAGIGVTAPEGIDYTKVKYKSKAYGASSWVTDQSFVSDRDGENYITLWAHANEEKIEIAKNNEEVILAQWGFDWNGDGVYEQYVNFELDPELLVLDKTNLYAMDEKAPVIDAGDFSDEAKVEWTADSVTVTGTANDAEEIYASGVKEVYCLDSNDVKIEGFNYDNGNFSFIVDAEGESTYTIVCIDNSGKTTELVVYAKVDKSEPTISNVLIDGQSTPAQAKRTANAQLVTFDVDDAYSGVDSVAVNSSAIDASVPEFEVNANGTYEIKVTDGVGKQVSTIVTIDNFDDEAPSATLNLPNNSDNWFARIGSFIRKILKIEDNATSINSTVILSVDDVKSDGENDSFSGISEAYYWLYNVNDKSIDIEDAIKDINIEDVKSNGVKWEVNEGDSYNKEIDLDVGETVVFVYAKDLAGNVLFDSTDGFVFEEDAPEISVTNNGAIVENGDDIKTNVEPSIEIKVQDTPTGGAFVSGIREIKMSVNDCEPISLGEAVSNIDDIASGKKDKLVFDKNDFSSILDLTADGIYNVVITATDMCGNTAEFSFKYKYDTTAPEFSELSYNKLEGETVWSESDSVTFVVTDKYTEKDGNKVFADVNEVSYAIVDSASADLTSADLAWNTVEINNGKFTVNTNDVVDGDYTMFVAVKYADDCGNETTPAIQSVEIKKDTVNPVIDRFELSVDKNNAIEGVINALSFGTLCKESIVVRVYASDDTSGLCENAIFNFKKDGVDTQVTDVALSADKTYYEYKLELSDDDKKSVTYSDLNVIISDNYTVNEDSTALYQHSADASMNENNTVIDTENTQILNSHISDITLENIAPEISDSVNEDTVKSYNDGVTTIYNDALATTYTVTDENSGIGEVVVTVSVNNSEAVTCKFNAYEDSGNNKVTEASFVYDADETTVSEIIDGTTVATKTVSELDISDENKIEITVKATDNADNTGETKTYNYVIDNKKPDVQIESNAIQYINEDVYYSFTTDELHIANTEAGVLSYKYNNEEKTMYTDNNFAVTLSDDGKYVIEGIVVTDLLGNETTIDSADFGVITEFVKDTVAPTIKNVTFESNSNLINCFRLMSFGVFTKDAVEVTFELDNSTPEYNSKQFTSPLESALLKLTAVDNPENSKDIEPSNIQKNLNEDGSATIGWTVTYLVPLETIGYFSFEAIDVADNTTGVKTVRNNEDFSVVCKGKTSEEASESEEKIIESNFFLSENTAPEITITKSAEGIYDETSNARLTYYYDNNGKLWFNDDVIIPIEIVDPENEDALASGIYSVETTVNGKAYEDATAVYNSYSNTDDYYANAEKTLNFTINTADCEIKEDASYMIVITVTDYAGNVSTDKITIYKDTETAYVNDFKFDGIGYQDSLNNDGKVELVKLNDSKYGYYFSSDTKVTITADDKNDKNTAVGVKSISYFAVDIDPAKEIIKGIDIAVDANNQVEFTVPANFKGQIYAYATDYLGNNYETALICKENNEKLTENPMSEEDSTPCVIPDKTIVESASKHSDETHITYDVITKTTTKDASGLPLYNKAVAVKVTITDTYSGIRSGNVVVTSDESNVGTDDTSFEIQNSGLSVNSKINGWNVDEMDGNLVTKISKTITITRNSNNILVTTSMVDRAGNETNDIKLGKFGIDTVSPQITVRYSNNSASDGKYFKENRTATITVKERNFDPSLVVAQINGKNVSLNWNSNSYTKNTNTEGTSYTATITYGSDGDYKFSITCKDRAGNAENSPNKYTGQIAPTDFVIDKTAPVVTVTNTSSATPQNTNYYSKPVQVTITVVEHNWDASKFHITYAENDSAVSKALSWSNNGDTHVATFACDSLTGLKYTIDYALADKAENNAVFIQNGVRVNDYKADEFYVDQTIPEIRFTGAIEGSHNNGTVESGVVLSDTYFDRVEVTLSGKRRGVVFEKTYNATSVDITEFIETTRDKDDYYTVSVVAYDKAGNRNSTPATRSYSVNRNGSMFVLSDEAKKLNEGKNSKNIVNSNIVIYEYNVDNTVSTQVELWKNGNVTKLANGSSGYIVSTTENRNGYVCNTYSIAASLFADDAAYRVYITTNDEAGNISTNTSKNSVATAELDKNDGEAPILSFIKDTTAPTIDVNLDINKSDKYYQIKQASYVVTFNIADVGSGVNLDTVRVTYGDGDKSEVLELIKNEDGSYSVELKGRYDNLSFTFSDNAGNEFTSLIFKRVTVSENALALYVANTPLFAGSVSATVVIAILVIILVAKKRKSNQ